MKSAYIFILFLIVLLACWAFFAKLATHINLGSKRLPPPAEFHEPIAPEGSEDAAVDLQEFTPSEAIDQQIISFSCGQRIDQIVASDIRAQEQQTQPITVSIPAGSVFESNGSHTEFMCLSDISISFGNLESAANESASTEPTSKIPASTSSEKVIPVVALDLKPSPVGVTLTVSSGEESVEDLNILKNAPWHIAQYATWLTRHDPELHELPKFIDGRPAILQSTQSVRIRPCVIDAETETQIRAVFSKLSLPADSCTALNELTEYRGQQEAEKLVLMAYELWSTNSKECPAALTAASRQKRSLIGTEASALLALWDARDPVDKPTSARKAFRTVSETIENLQQRNYPAEDLKAIRKTTMNECLVKSLDNEQLGFFIALYSEYLIDYPNDPIEEFETVTNQLHNAIPALQAVVLQSVGTMEQKSALTYETLEQARDIFQPNDEFLAALNSHSGMQLDEIPRSRQREVFRQCSSMELNLAEVMFENELFQFAKRHAERAMNQKSKAPGVQSKASRLLRLSEKELSAITPDTTNNNAAQRDTEASQTGVKP